MDAFLKNYWRGVCVCKEKKKEKSDFQIWHPLEITEYKNSLNSVIVPLRIPLWFSPTADFQTLKQKQACLSFRMSEFSQVAEK